MKTNKIRNLAVMIVVGLLTSLTLTSCPDGPIDDDDKTDNAASNYKAEQLISTLQNSTWRITSTDGENTSPLRVYFSDEIFEEGKTFKDLKFVCDGEIKTGLWGVCLLGEPNPKFKFYVGMLKSGDLEWNMNVTTGDVARFKKKYGLRQYYGLEDVSISTEKVVISVPQRYDETTNYTSKPYTVTFTRAGTGNLINGGSTGGGGTSNSGDFYETNFNSTEYSTKIKVDFYFSEKLSSATIKYGTTSSCSSSKSATVSGVCATATISGLKAGTKYYFKCTAKSKNGESCTTGVYPAMTTY